MVCARRGRAYVTISPHFADLPTVDRATACSERLPFRLLERTEETQLSDRLAVTNDASDYRVRSLLNHTDRDGSLPVLQRTVTSDPQRGALGILPGSYVSRRCSRRTNLFSPNACTRGAPHASVPAHAAAFVQGCSPSPHQASLTMSRAGCPRLHPILIHRRQTSYGGNLSCHSCLTQIATVRTN